MKTLLSILTMLLWLSSNGQVLGLKGMIDSTNNIGIGTAFPANVLHVKNRVGFDGLTIQGGNGASTVPTLSFLDSTGSLQGSMTATNNNGTALSLRGITFRTPAATTPGDSWYVMRFNSASNKIGFGSTGYQEFIQTGHRLTFAPDKVGNVTNDTTSSSAIVIMKGTGVGVGTGGSDPAASAILELKSTTKGLLLPRVTGAQMNAIAAPATGLLVFNTDSVANCYWTGSTWANVLGAGGGGAFAGMTAPDTISIIAPTSRINTLSGTDFSTSVATAAASGLVLWARANKKYELTGELKVTCNGVGGIRLGFSGPNGIAIITGSWTGIGATNAVSNMYAAPGPGSMLATGFARSTPGTQPVFFRIYLTTSATAGPINIIAASATATQISSIVVGSTIQLQEIN